MQTAADCRDGEYAHVTFFNGGQEQKFDGEERILVASPDVATYDLKPEMSAPEVTDKLVAPFDPRPSISFSSIMPILIWSATQVTSTPP